MSEPRRLPELAPVNFPTLGWQIVDWWETFIRHGPGDVIGLPMRLDDEEILHLCWCYRLTRRGRRVFRRVVRVRPKGRRKSELAGGIACVEAIGPCRFSHWARRGEVSWWGYEYEPGEPVGRPVDTPILRALATEEDQTGNCYDNVYEMLRGPEIREHWPGLKVGLTRTFLPAGGEITPSTSAADSKEGGKESWAGADEVYLWHTPRLKRQHRMVSRNLAKRKAAEGWMYETSNSHEPGKGSVLERAYEYGLKLGTLDAMVKAGVLIDWKEPADPLRGRAFLDDRKLRAALADVYGPAREWIDLDRIVSEVRDPESTEEDSRRAWLNQVVEEGSSWLDLATFRGRGVKRVIRPGEVVAAGFDGSRFNDSTALVVVTEDGFLAPWQVWERDHSDPDWSVPLDGVDAAVEEMFQTLRVARFYCDPYLWDDAIARWHQRHGRAVREWATSRLAAMAFAIHEFETAVRAGTLTHNGDKRLIAHVGNAYKREVNVNLDDQGTKGHILSKETKYSPRKIDIAVASVVGWQARSDALMAREFRKLRPRPKPQMKAVFRR